MDPNNSVIKRLWYIWKSFSLTSIWAASNEKVPLNMCKMYRFRSEGYEFEPLISCPLHTFFTPWRIFIKLWSNVCIIDTMCRIHNSVKPTQGQGHNWSSKFDPLCPLHIPSIPGRIFIKLWSNVWVSETMCRTDNSTMRTQGQGHNWRSQVWIFDFLSTPLQDFRKVMKWSNQLVQILGGRGSTSQSLAWYPIKWKILVMTCASHFVPLHQLYKTASWLIWVFSFFHIPKLPKFNAFSILGKNDSRQHLDFFFLFFPRK